MSSKPEITPASSDEGDAINQHPLRKATAELCLWNPQPVSRPKVDPGILHLRAHQRSVEVIVHWLARMEHWLSPSGWLRAWIRLNVWIAVVLAISAVTAVPAVTAVVAGLTELTREVSFLSDDVGRSFLSLLPVFGSLSVIGLGIYFVRRRQWPIRWTMNGKEEPDENSL